MVTKKLKSQPSRIYFIRSCISKITNTFFENSEDLDIVVLMYNLLEYNSNCFMASGSLWDYYRDNINDDANENNDTGNYRINNNKTRASKSFEYKPKLIGSTPADNSRLDAGAVATLKHLGKFLRSIGLSLINCEIELDSVEEQLKWVEIIQWKQINNWFNFK